MEFPKPLLESSAEADLGSELLRFARRDAPEPEFAEQLTHSALGATLPPGMVEPGGATAAAGTSLLGKKAVVGMAMVGAGLGGGGVYLALQGEPQPAPSSVATVSAPAPQPVVVDEEQPVEAEEQAPDPRVQPKPVKRKLAKPAESPGQSSQLAEELAKLKQARQKLQSGKAAAALGIVSDFHRQFPKAKLWPEAEAVAIEALARLGRTHAALERSERFMKVAGESPQAGRISTLRARLRSKLNRAD